MSGVLPTCHGYSEKWLHDGGIVLLRTAAMAACPSLASVHPSDAHPSRVCCVALPRGSSHHIRTMSSSRLEAGPWPRVTAGKQNTARLRSDPASSSSHSCLRSPMKSSFSPFQVLSQIRVVQCFESVFSVLVSSNISPIRFP